MAEAFGANDALISCEQLRRDLGRPQQVILDATFFLPRQQRMHCESFRLRTYPVRNFSISTTLQIDQLRYRTPRPMPSNLPYKLGC